MPFHRASSSTAKRENELKETRGFAVVGPRERDAKGQSLADASRFNYSMKF